MKNETSLNHQTPPIANVLLAAGWIPVTKKLPENFQSVLCHTHVGNMVVQSYSLHTEQDYKWFKERFTHWMELPLPPACSYQKGGILNTNNNRKDER